MSSLELCPLKMGDYLEMCLLSAKEVTMMTLSMHQKQM